MGSYFANLYAKSKNFDALREEIVKYFASREITPTDSDNADIVISVYAPEGSEWTSVCSDAFTHEDILTLAPVISNVTETDVLSAACFDSDYLFLNLLNTSDSTDAWLNIGKSYEIKAPRRSNVTAWKSKIRDFDSFKTAAKGKYICAEEFLFSVAANLGISPEQIDGFEAPEDCPKLYFSAPKIDEENIEPTRFTARTFSMKPCRIGKAEICNIVNRGAASQGIAVLFTGSYVENDEITFKNTEIRTTKSQNDKFKSCPFKLEKIKLEDGSMAYYWEDKNFRIPERVSPDLPPSVFADKEYSREILIAFTPIGDPRKVLDITVTVIPLANPTEGQFSWYVWKGYGSKRKYIEIRNYYEKNFSKQFGREAHFYNPDDYDLD